MKREFAVVLILSFILIFSVSFISANIFTDFWNKITGKATTGVCGNGILETGELCDYTASDSINNPYGTQCSTNCWVNGAPPYWAGCRGSGAHVCTDNPKVTDQYFVDHPKCIKNPTCAGLFYYCNGVVCPEPVSATTNVTNNTQTNTTTFITNCMEITSPGNYVLANNIIATGEKCIYIYNTSNVNLDCQNRIIDLNGYGFIKGGIQIENVQSFQFNNCLIKNVNLNPLVISNSESGIIKDNKISNYIEDISSIPTIHVVESNHLSFSENDVYGYVAHKSNDILLQNNIFNSVPIKGSIAGVVISNNGYNNQFIQNSIDGASNGVLQDSLGADDGIILHNEINDTIKKNKIQNNWDCGIEGTGYLYNSIIKDNFIRNNGLCGIGAWYWMSWQNNTIENNIIDDANSMFVFFRWFPLSSSEEKYYFKNNLFYNNVLINPKNLTIYDTSAYFNLFENVEGIIDINNTDFTNNILKSNDFTKIKPAPLLLPREAFVDAGGNICGSKNSSFGLTYSYLECENVTNNNQTNIYCVDSDSGLNYYRKGQANDGYGNILEDTCVDSGQLQEYYCGDNINEQYGNTLTFAYKDCGNRCSDGKCIKRTVFDRFKRFLKEIF